MNVLRVVVLQTFLTFVIIGSLFECPKLFISAISTTSPICDVKEIDAVISWVNGSDPLWKASFNDYFAKESNKIVISDAGESRYRDFEQLRLTIRSIRLYTPWVRNIYIFTANEQQIPSWLNIQEAKKNNIFVVHHYEALGVDPDIPSEILPTFNSKVIELLMYKIPGISECFLYLNDDHFIAKYTPIEEFYIPVQNRLVHYLSNSLIPTDTTELKSFQRSWFHAHNQLKLKVEEDERTLPLDSPLLPIVPSSLIFPSLRWTMHGPLILKRSWIKIALHMLQKEVKNTLYRRFRTETDISLTMVLFNHYMVLYQTHLSKFIIQNSQYLMIFSLSSIEKSLPHFAKDSLTKPFFVCIQDNIHDEKDLENSRKILHQVSENLFSEVPPWEKPANQPFLKRRIF